MKISVIGNGKMGKEVIKTAQERNHQIINIFDIENKPELTIDNLKKADIVFEFTQPEFAFENVSLCLDADVACVCGTTGWIDKIDVIQRRCNEENKSFFYASNFSIGVNILYEINKKLANMMNNYPSYEVSIEEIHHIHKLDAPSGTAIQIANLIIDEIDRKNKWTLNKKNDNEIEIKAIREGEIAGIHKVKYESDVDFIEIKHSSKNRKGLALGAVLAAEFVFGKKGFYTMKDLLNI